jgi:hypothetical protein
VAAVFERHGQVDAHPQRWPRPAELDHRCSVGARLLSGELEVLSFATKRA